MPVRWTVSHPDRQIVAIAEGTVTLQQIENYLDGVITSNTLCYRKIFDVTQTVEHPSDADMLTLAARIRAYPLFGRFGALAIVASSHRSRWIARLYTELAKADRPIKTFRKREAAQKWLDTQPHVDWAGTP